MGMLCVCGGGERTNVRPDPQDAPSLNRLPTQMQITERHVRYPEKYTPKALKRSQKILQEIFDSEVTYIQGLRKIYEVFLYPLWRYRAISSSDLNQFESIKMLLSFHVKFLEILEAEIDFANADDRWEGIIGTFDEMVVIYRTYMNQYENILDTISSIRNSNKTVNKHFNEQQYPIDAFLILPVQRIPRYKLLFQNLLKHTPPHYSPKEHKTLKRLIDEIEKTLIDTNNARRDHDMALQLLHVGSKLKNLNQPFACYERRLVVEKPCYFAKGKSQPGHFILCNDILLLCTKEWSVFVWLNIDAIEDVSQCGDSVIISRKLSKKRLDHIQSAPVINLRRRLTVESRKSQEYIWVLYAKNEEEAIEWHQLLIQEHAGTYLKAPQSPVKENVSDELYSTVFLEKLATLRAPSPSTCSVAREFRRRTKSFINMKFNTARTPNIGYKGSYTRNPENSNRAKSDIINGKLYSPTESFNLEKIVEQWGVDMDLDNNGQTGDYNVSTTGVDTPSPPGFLAGVNFSKNNSNPFDTLRSPVSTSDSQFFSDQSLLSPAEYAEMLSEREDSVGKILGDFNLEGERDHLLWDMDEDDIEGSDSENGEIETDVVKAISQESGKQTLV